MRQLVPYLLVAVLASALTHALGYRGIPPAAAQPEPAPPPRAVPPEPLPAGLTPDEQAGVRVYQVVNRSVAHITTRTLEADDFFMRAVPREGSGSGSILDTKGHILTNHHVIDGARQINVTLYDGSSHQAELVGADPSNDLAVLRVDAPAEKLHPIGWGDSSKLIVGLRVFALGNPFGLERTLTHGIVGSLNRTLRTENDRLIRGVIQTDAAINPGSSGGPLLNTRGEMVGITTAIIGRASQHSGVGLAIPANTARRITDELIRFGRVIRSDCGIFSVYELEKGLLVGRLVPDGPAEKAGLRGPEVSTVRRGAFLYRSLDRSKADLVVAVDGKPVRTLDDLLTLVEGKKPGTKVAFTIVREGKRLEVEVELVELRN